jgi:hypothetical protein
MKVWEKMRENRQLQKEEKLRQKELDRQRQEEAERIQKMFDDPAVSREDALNAMRTWINNWMDD